MKSAIIALVLAGLSCLFVAVLRSFWYVMALRSGKDVEMTHKTGKSSWSFKVSAPRSESVEE